MEPVFFNAKWFGDYLRETRKAAGYKNTRLFSEAIEERTGVYVDYNSLDRYERGERMPGVDRFFAIVATLEESGYDHTFGLLAQFFYSKSLDGAIALEQVEQRIDDTETDIELSIPFGDTDYLLSYYDKQLENLVKTQKALEKITLTSESEQAKRELLLAKIPELARKAKAKKRQIERENSTKPAQ